MSSPSPIPIQNAQGQQDNIAAFAVSVSGVTLYLQACAVVDGSTGNPASVTTLGSRGTYGLVIQGDPSAVPVPVTTYQQGATTASLTQPTVMTAAVTLLNPNSLRLACLLYNSGSEVVYVAYGSTVSTTAYSFQIAPGEVQIIDSIPWRGALTGIVATGSAQLFITELSP